MAATACKLAAILALATLAAGRLGGGGTTEPTGELAHRTLLQRPPPCGGRQCTGNEVCAPLFGGPRCVCKPGKWALRSVAVFGHARPSLLAIFRYRYPARERTARSLSSTRRHQTSRLCAGKCSCQQGNARQCVDKSAACPSGFPAVNEADGTPCEWGAQRLCGMQCSSWTPARPAHSASAFALPLPRPCRLRPGWLLPLHHLHRQPLCARWDLLHHSRQLPGQRGVHWRRRPVCVQGRQAARKPRLQPNPRAAQTMPAGVASGCGNSADLSRSPLHPPALQALATAMPCWLAARPT